MTDLQTVDRIMRIEKHLKRIEDLCKTEISEYSELSAAVASNYLSGRNDFASEVYSILDIG